MEEEKKIPKGRGKIKMVEKRKLTSGITLIALVITIVVLLILAGVSIAMLTGNNRHFNTSTNSKREY